MKNEQEIKNTLITKASEDAEFGAELLENPHTGKLSEPEIAAIAGARIATAQETAVAAVAVPAYP